MSKELTPLKALERYGYHCNHYVNGKKDYKIIETALKDNEQYEKILNDYGLTLVNFREACLLLAMIKGEGRNIHNINKQLKALEIIEEKRVDVLKLDYYGWQLDLYNEDLRDEYRLTQKEYDLLKEVLL